MTKIKDNYLKRILYLLLIIFITLLIIKEMKILSLCCTLCNILLPLIIGFCLSWILKPICLFINKKFNILTSTIITYLIIIILLFILCYFIIPILIKEISNIMPLLISFYNKIPSTYKGEDIIKSVFKLFKNCTGNIKSIITNIFYSALISFYFLLENKKISKYISKRFPSKLIRDISISLKSFIKGTLIDTLLLFILTLISLYLLKMPYYLLFSIFIAITNIIPYIGPYIGGIPCVIVALSSSINYGLLILVIIIVLQFIESEIFHPIIMGKSIKISPIIIIIGLIVFGRLFGILGLIISTPVICIIKPCYIYFKQLHDK